jgi:hypothetical protein
MLKALRESKFGKQLVKPEQLKSKEVMPAEAKPAQRPVVEKPRSEASIQAGACPVCEARRERRREAQKRYMDKLRGKR